MNKRKNPAKNEVPLYIEGIGTEDFSATASVSCR